LNSLEHGSGNELSVLLSDRFVQSTLGRTE
jgi:hypothetical protein